MVEPAASAMRAMVADAGVTGVELAASGTWRSLQQQVDLFTQRFSRTPRGPRSKQWDGLPWWPNQGYTVDAAGTPGTSNHGLGLAADLSCREWNIPLTGVELQWLADNGPRFGFWNTVKSERHHWTYGLGDNVTDAVGQPGPAGPAPDWELIKKIDTELSQVQFPGALTLGAVGTAVTALEWKLKAAGYGVNVDEHFDEGTEAAVKMFELNNGLTGDGVVDAVLWGRLGLPGGAGGAPPLDALHEIPDAEDAVLTFTAPLSVGSSGNDVAAVQLKLASFGYTVQRNGEFSEHMKNAIMHFQKVNNREQTGQVDEALWRLLGLT